MADPDTSSPIKLPRFVRDVLPPVDYPLTLKQLRASHLVTGQGNPSRSWDRAWRNELVTRLETLVHQLWDVDITAIYADGSFVENKDHPNDVDGYFECDPHEFREKVRLLNELDPFKVWTWDEKRRTLDQNSANCSFPCGIVTAWNSTRIWGNPPAF